MAGPLTAARRLFDARDALTRAVLVDLSGAAYLTYITLSGFPPTAAQLALAGCAFTAALLLYRRPVPGLFVQTGLLVAGYLLTSDPTIHRVGTSWVLLELTMVAGTPRVVAAAALLLTVHLAFGAGRSWRELAGALFGMSAVLGGPLLIGLVIRTTRELGREQRERLVEQQQHRESEARAARAEERATIARELHDVVAHHVASMVLHAGVARHVLPDADPRVRQVFDDMHATGTAALADLRRLVALLRGPDGVTGDAALTAIEPGALPAALGAAVAVAERAGLRVTADVDDAVGTVDAARGLAVLRLTQEALTNVGKHAGTAARARLCVVVTDGTVHWEVADDGGDGAAADPPPGGGHGLTGMRERVAVLGGHLEAGRYAGGWRVTATLPEPA